MRQRILAWEGGSYLIPVVDLEWWVVVFKNEAADFGLGGGWLSYTGS